MPTTFNTKPHTGGVSFGGMTTAPWTEARYAEQRAMLARRAAERVETATDRFRNAIRAVEKTAEPGSAISYICVLALACADRGLDDANEHRRADRHVEGLEELGADVRSARRALDELMQPKAVA